MQKNRGTIEEAPVTLGDLVALVYDHFSPVEFDPATRSQRVANCLLSRLGAHPQLLDKLFA